MGKADDGSNADDIRAKARRQKIQSWSYEFKPNVKQEERLRQGEEHMKSEQIILRKAKEK